MAKSEWDKTFQIFCLILAELGAKLCVLKTGTKNIKFNLFILVN